MPLDFDPKYLPAEQKTQEPSLEGLIAFCESHDPDEQYCYSDAGRCLLALYNVSIGRKYTVSPASVPCAFSGFSGWCPDVATVRALPIDQMLEEVAVCGEHTFGAAAERARALLART